MPKEVIAAIIVGGFLGVAIAFGVWRANIALSPQRQLGQTESTSSPTTTPATPTTPSLTVTSPEDDSIVTTSTITVTGSANSGSTIAISSDRGETIVTSDSKGNFTTDIELGEGINVITVTAFSEDGETIEKQVTVVYSTELN